MNSTDSINRQALLALVKLVQPALSTQDYIPILKHVAFGDGCISAYNDIGAIRVALPSTDLDLAVCMPGDLLGKALASFSAEEIVVTPGKDSSAVIASGRSKVKIPTLPIADFPLTMPKGKPTAIITASDDLLLGIQMCLLSVGNDPTHPATMGITLDADDGLAVLFSTDNVSISRYQTSTKLKLPGGAPVIFPAFFCAQLLSLAKSFPKADVDIEMWPGALVARFIETDDRRETENATLFQKTLVDEVDPFDFPAVMKKHATTQDLKRGYAEIPDAFDAAFQRAMMILGSEVDKATKVSGKASGIQLLTTSPNGEAQDSISFDEAPAPDEPFHIDPSLILRASSKCSKVGFFNRVVAMTNKDGTFVHLIAHCSV